MNNCPSARWSTLDAKRTSHLQRCERYAGWTLPYICPPDHYDHNGEEMSQDFQSLGAEGVNHLTNKLMLALFAPSRPFFRIELEGASADRNNDPEVLEQLTAAETAAIKELDKRNIRPVLFAAMKHLLVTGNVLVHYEASSCRVLGIKAYTVVRDVSGKVLELVIRETIHETELDDKVIAAVGTNSLGADADGNVKHYRRLVWDGKHYLETQAIGNTELPEEFNGKYTEEKMPYHPLTWELPAGGHYGVGLVEMFAGAFAGLSTMSQATVQAALLASEFRWLVDPMGVTRPEELAQSRNGDALAGKQGDITLLRSEKGSDLQINLRIADTYVQQIGRAFLLSSAVVRDSERTTAEEVRMTAQELETGLGGTYSHVAVSFQKPMALWLLKLAGKDIAGSDADVAIVTGLAAMSRAGDRDQLMQFLGDLAAISNLPPEAQGRLRLEAIMTALAAARGLSRTTYMLSEKEYADKMEQQQRAAMMEELANRMPIASPEGVDASQAIIAGKAMNAAASARRQSN